MRADLMRTGRLRKLVRCMACIVYPIVLIWFGFSFFGNFLIGYSGYFASANTWIYVLIGFAVFLVMHAIFMLSLTALSRQEYQTMRKIIAQLFPDAKYNPQGIVNLRLLAHSRLFGASESSWETVNATSYGRIDIPVGDQKMRISDVGVTAEKKNALSSMNFFGLLYQSLVRPIFGVRVESTMHSFRGMFCHCQLQRPINGSVILLPDHLENKIGYLARTVQGFKQKFGARFIHLEDPEFESFFAVYADDEVEARMILTPAMMRKITEFRRSFNRDMMFSFNENMFYYASGTPDGFLRPGRKSLDNGHLLEQLYREIDLCRTIRTEMSNR